MMRIEEYRSLDYVTKAVDRAIHISHVSQDRKAEYTGVTVMTRASYFHGACYFPII